ncbi:MAG: polysaccharide biosynthesis C-terminal domain-containing protein, partial [Lachnospiraceae bacterium]|nr:polysaccharide biosynthesis C-terminal domain-containing protein [Lachnospiraceae bacterium]
LIEQFCRVLSVYVITSIGIVQGSAPTLNVTVIGVVIGEIISTLVTLTAFFRHISVNRIPYTPAKSISYGTLLAMIMPLIANRITLNLLQSIETVSIPAKLRLYGYDNSTALSVYGVLTGMAFPLLFFPNAITGSFAVLLLPLISERISLGDTAGVKQLTVKTIRYCSILGFSCMSIFLLFGGLLGKVLFDSELAGFFISTLSFICPFLYLNNTLSAILQGMGKVLPLFIINVAALLIRLLFIYLFIPIYGIQGYLWGLLVSQLFLSTAYLFITIRAHR